MRRKILSVVIAFCLMLTLTGCGNSGNARDSAEAPTLPPAQAPYEAPDGDFPVAEEKIYTIYLPGQNGLHLVAQHISLEPDTLHNTIETLVRELLSFPGNDQVSAPGGETELTLFGDNPVELSGGVCTVNLGSSALQLSYRNFYYLAQSLAASLCELEEVDYVNVLVADQGVGLDTTGGLAMGSQTAHLGENLPVLWEQTEARKTPLGNDMSKMPLSSRVTLYFPLENGEGMVCETADIAFDGQTPQQMAARILEVMSAGSREVTGVPNMPDILSLLIHEPLASELADGGRLITLSFRENAWAELESMEVDPECLLAAVTWSLLTFIPGTAAVSLRVGEQPVTLLNSERYGEIPILGGLMHRADFTAFLKGRTTVYFEKDGKLAPCEKAVEQDKSDSPREQLGALLGGPGKRELAEGFLPLIPGEVGEEDILGISAVGDTLLVNLSESFRTGIYSAGAEREMLLCYSMVNTLCHNTGKNRVCFFFEGEQVERIAGEIYWAGVFMRNDGLIELSFG